MTVTDPSFYRERFVSRHGLLVSLAGDLPLGEQELMVDGSASLIRQDSSWMTYYKIRYPIHPGRSKVSLGFAWKDNSIIKCGYANDAYTMARYFNGMQDRCGEYSLGMGLAPIIIAGILAASVFIPGALYWAGVTCARTTQYICVLIALVLILILWALLYSNMRGKGWIGVAIQTSVKCTLDSQKCIDEVLARGRRSHHCPSGLTRSSILLSAIVALAAVSVGVVVSVRYKMSRLASASAIGVLTILCLAILGWSRGMPMFSPIGAMCNWENEFVINLDWEPFPYTGIDTLPLYDFVKPSALVVFRTPSLKYDPNDFVGLDAYFEKGFPVFSITYESFDSEPIISDTVKLVDVARVFQ
jgi:hypothetical protein